MVNNKQSAALNNEQLQVLISGKFGDGCFSTPKTATSNSSFYTNCIHKEYIEYKRQLLGNISSEIKECTNKGFKEGIIYKIYTPAIPGITYVRNLSIEEALNKLDTLGIALWFYDDGSLHKDKLFYNLNTQAFSEEVNRDLFVPFLEKFNIRATPTIERKKDGKEFWYLRIGKYNGACEIASILSKHYVDCFNYKIWSSETIQKWSKLQAQLKSIPLDIKEIHPRTLNSLMDKDLSNEDIVRVIDTARKRALRRAVSKK